MAKQTKLRCDHCQEITYMFYECEINGQRALLCRRCRIIARDTAGSAVGSDWIQVPKGCMVKLLFARWLYDHGKLTEGVKVAG